MQYHTTKVKMLVNTIHIKREEKFRKSKEGWLNQSNQHRANYPQIKLLSLKLH